MTHSEYPILRKIFLQWIFVERMVLYIQAEKFYADIIEKINFEADDEEEKSNSFILCRNYLHLRYPNFFGLL